MSHLTTISLALTAAAPTSHHASVALEVWAIATASRNDVEGSAHEYAEHQGDDNPRGDPGGLKRQMCLSPKPHQSDTDTLKAYGKDRIPAPIAEFAKVMAELRAR